MDNITLMQRAHYTVTPEFSDDGRAAFVAGPPSSRPSGTVTMLFTDIVASTRIKCLLNGTEAEKNAEWLQRFQEPHHALVRRCLNEQHGYEVKTMGDAFFATFDDPARAVRCAVQIQRGLAAANLITPLPAGTPLMVRIGIHTGQARKLDNGDYIGTSVDKAARVETAAGAGQVLLSEQTASLVREQFPEWTFHSHGVFDLPGLGEHNLIEVLWDGKTPTPISSARKKLLPALHYGSNYKKRAPKTTSEKSIGGFELRGRIGAGGMGVVYRAWQPSEDREVALKCLHLGDDTARNRFLVEIRALGKVEHPNLVRIYSSGADEQQMYYAMEIVDGANIKSLYRQLRKSAEGELDDNTWRAVLDSASDETRSTEQPLEQTARDPAAEPQAESSEGLDYLEIAPRGICQSQSYIRRIVAIVQDIARATHALHEKGVIHRDIKPENIMLTRDGSRAVLMDLGIAKMKESDSRLTRTREFVGSLRYASPEQVLDAGEVDRRSDIYSLGVTLWELLTLQPIYGIGKNTRNAQAMLKIEIEEPETVRKYNRAASIDLQAIVQKSLEKNPERRYQSAAELAADLEQFLQGQPVQARPVSVVTRLWRRCRRRPLVPALTSSLVLLAVVFALAFVRWPNNKLRIGIKPWVGFAPLFVAAELRLCDWVDLEFVPAENIEAARTLLAQGKIDAGLWLVDSHVHTRSRGIPTKVVLKLDTSLGADAIVARNDIKSFSDLKGKTIAYEYLDAPHFLFLTLCEKHDLKPSDFILVRRTAKEAVRDFIDGKVDAAITYDPFMQEALKVGHLLASSKDADAYGSIVDILTVDEEFLKTDRPKVEALIKGWFRAVELLESGDPMAITMACKNLKITPHEYSQMAAGMRYASVADNLDFFRVHQGSSDFRRLMSAAQDRWDRYQQLGRRTAPADGDGSGILFEIYRE